MNPYKSKLDKYSDEAINDDLTHYAEKLIEKATGEGIAVTEDPNKVKHMVSRDVRSMLPPQIYEVIGLIATIIEETTHNKK